MRHLALIMLAAAAVLLAGCALSPQRVEIQPDIELASANLGHNQPVNVIAVDARDSKAFGTRGGVYADSATIMPANDVDQAIADAVRRGLQSLGFNAYNPGTGATTLEVRLEKLEYVPQPDALLSKVRLNLTLSAIAKRDNVTHTATYESSATRQFLFTPSQGTNQDLINGILGKTIQRMLNDPEMIRFLAGGSAPATPAQHQAPAVHPAPRPAPASTRHHESGRSHECAAAEPGCPMHRD